jgi:pimeloyl-ACP methyl ester carboxylesterase
MGAIAILMTAGLVLQRAVFEREAKSFTAPGERVVVDTRGRRLHVVCQGTRRADGPTVVLEAGGTHFSTQYTFVARELAKETQVCAYDRAGMGWSDPSSARRTARALTDDLDGLLTSAHIAPPYVLVGGSAGGLTVELYAREHTERVAGLVLLDALTGRMIDDMPAAGDKLARQACLARALDEVGVLRLLDPLGRRKLTEAREVNLALTYRTDAWDAVCSLLEARRASADQIRAAPPLRGDMPLVVLRHDTKLPWDDEPAWETAQEKNARLTTRGTLIVAERSGHHIAEDRPDLVIAAVKSVSQNREAERGQDRTR